MNIVVIKILIDFGADVPIGLYMCKKFAIG